MSAENELALANYAKFVSQRGFSLTPRQLKLFALEISNLSGDNPFNQNTGPSYKWLRSFAKRHNLTTRTPHMVEASHTSYHRLALVIFIHCLKKNWT